MNNKKDLPYGTHLTHLSKLKDYVGKEIGLTDWNLMTQEKIDSFAEVTEDFQWIHLDKKRAAKESPYKKTIAHGFIVFSFTLLILCGHICQLLGLFFFFAQCNKSVLTVINVLSSIILFFCFFSHDLVTYLALGDLPGSIFGGSGDAFVAQGVPRDEIDQQKQVVWQRKNGL